MKVVGIDFVDTASDSYDELTVIYFTAPHRVDFRSLVGELARAHVAQRFSNSTNSALVRTPIAGRRAPAGRPLR